MSTHKMNANRSQNQIKHILSIGTICGLILATLLVLGVRDATRAAAQSSFDTPATVDAAASTAQIGSLTNGASDLQNQVATLQAQNQQLRAELQSAEAQANQYEQQLAQAVQIIQQIQGQPQTSRRFR
ncbi:MAG: hypothetical protein KDE54_11755 [Caldilineaceae bacterium]|nr:hypothetical protein [Caldilineaceae bacterium]